MNDNVEVDPSFGAIGGGWSNYLGWDAWGSAIAGGVFDTITTQIGFIGGGRDNHVDNFNDFGSGIGTGQSNYTNANLGFIGGGESDTLLGDFSGIGSGRNNTVTTNGLASVIPGGDTLISNSYAQTVVGYNNIKSNAVTKAQAVAGGTGSPMENPLFIIGNGTTAANPANAFEVSYDGHSIVTDVLGPVGGRSYTVGGTYADNTVVAWGDISSSGGINASFGIASVTPGTGLDQGSYLIQLKSTQNFASATITVTLEQDDTTGLSSINQSLTPPAVLASGVIPEAGSCGLYVDASQIGILAPPYQNAFIVHTRAGNATSCLLAPHAFFFKVCARPN